MQLNRLLFMLLLPCCRCLLSSRTTAVTDPFLNLRSFPANHRNSMTMTLRKRSTQQNAADEDNEHHIHQDEHPKRARVSKSSTKKKTRGKGPYLSKLLKVYKGTEDWHLPIFRNVKKYIEHKRHNIDTSMKVLYPGSSRHITASLIFEDVTYVDCDRKVGELFGDDRVKEWVQQHKEYTASSETTFLLGNFDTGLPLPLTSFDMMISACAGIVSTPCAKFLKEGGYLLVSDAHFDAREAFVNHKQFELIAVVDMDGTVREAPEGLEGHFTTTDGKALTRAQVDESKVTPKARRSFKLVKEEMFYLFRKTTVA